MELRADVATIEEYAARVRRGATGVGVIAGTIALGILVLDYRLMLLAFLVLAAPIVAFAEVVHLRRTAKAGGARLELTSTTVVVETGERRFELAPDVVVARAKPEALIVSFPLGENRWQMVVLPGEPTRIEAAGRALTGAGAKVVEEHGSAWFVVVILLGVLVMKAFAVTAGVLVTVAIANLGLLALGRGGSLTTAGAMLGGALVLLTGAALLRTRVVRG